MTISSSGKGNTKDAQCWYGGVLLNLNSNKKRNPGGTETAAAASVHASYVQMKRIEMQSILKARNALAVALEDSEIPRENNARNQNQAASRASPDQSTVDTCSNPLPPVLKRDKYTCSKCYARDICMLHNAAFEESNATTSGGVLVDLQSQIMNRMSSSAAVVEDQSGTNSSTRNNTTVNPSQAEVTSLAKDQCIKY